MSALISFRNTALPRAQRALGAYIFDDRGKSYLDGSGGAMTVSLGHGVPEILRAMQQQAQQFCFSYRTQFTNSPAEELADELISVAPPGITNVFFVNSGSEASELAIRSSIQYWREAGRPQKTLTLGRNVSYHGMTMGALSLSGHAGRRGDYANLLLPLAVGPQLAADSDGPGATDMIEHRRLWEQALEAAGPDNVAAIIVEPIVGAAGGALTPPTGYMQMLRDLCDKYEVLLIADEVITGLGRTGQWFASNQDDVTPDLITIAKGMTSGYTPMGAVLYRDKVVDAYRCGARLAPFGHTFSGNPLSAATALAVIKYLKGHSVLENVAARSAQLFKGLAELKAAMPSPIDNIRGRGLLLGFDLIDTRTGVAPDPSMQANLSFADDCQEEGLIVYPAGIAPNNNSAILSPPLTISTADSSELLKRLRAGLCRFSSRFRSS